MSQLYANNAISLLENNLPINGLSINVIPGDGVLYPQPTQPDDFFLITLEDDHAQNREIVKIIDRINDVLIIAPDGRGFENTIPQNWPINTLVDHRVTAYTFTNKQWVPGTVQDPNIQNVVQPTEIKLVDTYETAFPNKLSCKWLITVLNPITHQISVSEVLGCYRGPSLNPTFTVYAKTGDKLKYSIELIAIGAILQLKVINQEAVDLQVNWLRINY